MTRLRLNVCNKPIDEIAEIGLRAYHASDWYTAVEALTMLTNMDGTLWQCRFYLAMAHFRINNIALARQEFSDIAQWTQDIELKTKAIAAMRAINTPQVKPAS